MVVSTIQKKKQVKDYCPNCGWKVSTGQLNQSGNIVGQIIPEQSAIHASGQVQAERVDVDFFLALMGSHVFLAQYLSRREMARFFGQWHGAFIIDWMTGELASNHHTWQWKNLGHLGWWHSQYMEKIKMFQTTNQPINSNFSIATWIHWRLPSKIFKTSYFWCQTWPASRPSAGHIPWCSLSHPKSSPNSRAANPDEANSIEVCGKKSAGQWPRTGTSSF